MVKLNDASIDQLTDRFGFEYIKDLCREIETYTESHDSLSNNSYSYRGMNLRFAVERYLYIRSADSEVMFRHYLKTKKIDFLSEVDSQKVKIEEQPVFFCDFAIRGITKLFSHTKFAIKSLLRCLYFSLINSISKNQAIRPYKKSQILIRIINKKFSNYLKPITDRIEEQNIAYLCINDKKLHANLICKYLPSIYLRIYGNPFKSLFLSDALMNFQSLVWDAESTYTSLKKLKPKSVLVAEGNSPSDIITLEACKLLGIPCYCLQQGWATYVHTGFRQMDFTEMFVWGPTFAKKLQYYNPRQKFLITGSPTFKFQKLRQIPQQTKSLKRLSFFLQPPNRLLSYSSYLSFLSLIASISQEHPDILISVRDHPGKPLDQELKKQLQKYRPNVYFSNPTVEPLEAILNSSDMVISIYSTVLLEALALNVVPLICSIGSMPKYDSDIVSMGAAIEVHTISQAKTTIDSIVATPQLLLPFRKKIAEIATSFFANQDAVEIIMSRLNR